jgi:triphosphoribosyl-dephospho-CoA synthase
MSRTESGFALARTAAVEAFRTGCRYDVLALKPGNVSIECPGHGMTARDFLVSAAAAAAPATEIRNGLGASLRTAVEASVSAVGCNTNLGILLLCVPLLHAALKRDPARSLRLRLQHGLRATTVHDAAAAFVAIRRANPGGLGAAAREDVHTTPTLPLREIMELAATRDLIAAQYADDFAAIFEVGIPVLRDLCAQRESLQWAVTRCYLTFLGTYPDSHIARKWGPVVAETVRAQGRTVESTLKACEDPVRRLSILTEFDHALKRAGLNPGTSADLTVASVVAWLLEIALHTDSNGALFPRA